MINKSFFHKTVYGGCQQQYDPYLQAKNYYLSTGTFYVSWGLTIPNDLGRENIHFELLVIYTKVNPVSRSSRLVALLAYTVAATMI